MHPVSEAKCSVYKQRRHTKGKNWVFPKNTINKNIASWNMKMIHFSFPKVPRPWMPFLWFIFTRDVGCLLACVPLCLPPTSTSGSWHASPVGLRFNIAPHAFLGLRPFHGLWNILIWVLASLDWAQGQSADPAFMEGEEATPNPFPLPNSSWFCLFVFSLIRHPFLLWLSPFNRWTTRSILLPLWYWVPNSSSLDKLWAYHNIFGGICIEIKHKCRKVHGIQILKCVLFITKQCN